MSAWALSEVPTVVKMNQKTVFVGATAPSNPQDGQFWLDTSTNPYQLKMYHSVAAVWRLVEVPINKVKMPAAVAADYSTPSGTPVASSEGGVTVGAAWYDSQVGDVDVNVFAGYNTRVGQRINTAAIGSNKVARVKFQLRKVGSPTGTATVNMRKISDDSIVHTFGTIDVSTLTTSYVTYSFDATTLINPTYDIILCFEYNGGSNGTCPQMNVRDADVIANGSFRRYEGGAWTDETRDAWIIVYTGSGPANIATNAKDDNTATYWDPIPINEASAYIYFDLSSIQLVSGCRVYWLASGEIPASFNIDVSENASTWTNVKAITTAQTANAWNEYSWNTKRSRYIRIQVVSYGSATTIKLAEFDFYATITDRTIAEHGHGDQV